MFRKNDIEAPVAEIEVLHLCKDAKICFPLGTYVIQVV